MPADIRSSFGGPLLEVPLFFRNGYPADGSLGTAFRICMFSHCRFFGSVFLLPRRKTAAPDAPERRIFFAFLSPW